MIERKKKKCISCGRTEYLFSRGRCKSCTLREERYTLKKTKISPISQKEKERKKLYKILRKDYLKEHPKCEICGNEAGEIHHKSGRIGENLFNHFMAICRNCHVKIHDQMSHEEAVEKGYILPFKH